MAMPPDGSSTWFHHSDSLRLLDSDGETWGSLAVPVSRDRLGFHMPYRGDAWTSFHVCEIAFEEGKIVWRYYHPLLASAMAERGWTLDSALEKLVRHKEIRERGKFEGHVEAARLLATVEAARGEMRVHDARGACRLAVRLGGIPDFPSVEASGTIQEGGLVVGYAIPSSAGTRVVVQKTSLS